MAIEEIDDIPVTDDEGEESESPYRRRARAVQVRRGRVPRWHRFLRWALWGAMILPVAGYSGYRLAIYGLTSPHFMLTSGEDVVLSGNQYVTREEVMNALGLPQAGKAQAGINIFRLSLDEKRAQIESIPWVRSATLTRAYPNRLAVDLVERVPVAFVNIEGRVKLVDGEGVLLEKPERAAFNFPVLTGLDAASGRQERLNRLSIYEAFLREVGKEASAAGWMVSEVDLADADDLKATLVQAHDALQLYFGHEHFAERFRNFLILLPELRASGHKVDSIDLRYGNQIVVSPQVENPQQEGPPAGARGTREN